jgi:hypothetical protein
MNRNAMIAELAVKMNASHILGKAWSEIAASVLDLCGPEAQVIAAAHGMGLVFEGAAPPPKAKPSRVTCNPAAIKLALEQLK